MQDLKADKEIVLYKDLVVVGNGPGAICLSYILNGNWPYYNGQPHPRDDMLSARLSFVMEKVNDMKNDQEEKHNSHKSVSSKISLLNCSRNNLETLAGDIEGRGTFRPLAHLLDQLQHPCVDAGLNLPGLLTWRLTEHKVIDHVVLGKGPPGGAWQFMDPNVLTVSLNRWMSLPELDLQQWETTIETEQLYNVNIIHGKSNRNATIRRIPVGVVAAYYKDYVNRQGLAKNFKSGRTVTSVQPIKESIDTDDHYKWQVQGYENLSGRKFCYKSKNVVLATGTTNSFNRLGIPNEESQSSWVTHDLNDFESRLDRLKGQCPKHATLRDSNIDPVLVIGAGLSAADAIMAARARNISVIHAFRETLDISEDKLEVKSSPSIYEKLQSLPLSIYPEYHQIYEMMADSRNHRSYQPFPGYKLIDLGVRSNDSNKTKERRVSLQSPDGIVYSFRVSAVAILIGSKPDLSYLGEYAQKFGKTVDRPIDVRSNPIEIDEFTYEVIQSPRKGLYALGPLVGDNFVRFILGGAFGVAAHIFRCVECNIR